MNMDKELLLQLRKKNLRNFLTIFFSFTFFLVLLQFIGLGASTFKEQATVVFYLSTVTLVVFLAFIGIFYRLNNKCYNLLMNENISPEDKAEYLRKFHLTGSFLLGAATMVGLLMTLSACYYVNVLMTLYQIFIFYTMGHFVILTEIILFYYLEKTTYFPLSETIPFTPLTIVGKLVIPIGIILCIILSFMCSLSYRISYLGMKTRYTDSMINYINAQNDVLNTLIREAQAELSGYAASDEIQSQDPAKLIRFLRLVHETRNPNIETLLAVTANGHGYTSLGKDDDFSAQQFYLIPMKTGKPYMAPPHTSLITGKTVTTLVIPIKRDGAVVGLVGGSITVDTLNEALEDLNLFDRLRIWILDQESKIILHTDKSLIGMKVGKSPFLTSDGIVTTDVEKIITSKEAVEFDYVLNNTPVKAIKLKNEYTGWTVVVAEDLSVFLSGLNDAILEMFFLVNILAFLISVPALIITRTISKSIRSAITVISTLSTGNLNIKTDEVLIFHDEMGFLLKGFTNFTQKLRTIIAEVTETSFLLRSSSEELADASRSLSDGAQSRAASVEEATAAIEEVSSSVEQISNNAETQMNLASITYTSMEHLKRDIEEVIKYTADAIDTANKTSRQAQIGNKMMQDTISGMDNIDSSTKQIAEMVNIITDISDQVNLLALNASIEAARAGEHGKGFAIVAEEISKLADETATTAKSINDLVKTGLKEVFMGRRFVDNTKVAFDNIISQIRESENLILNIADSSKQHHVSSERVLIDTKNVLDMAEAINIATNEQMITNQEMSRTIEQINQGTLSEAARSEEIASSAADINSQAVNLMQNIEFFKL